MHEGRNPRRSKSGRDRNNYKSAPGPDTQRTETTSPIQRRHGRIGRRHVDERPAFRDIDRTCVPGTVWGTASNRTAKSRSTPCLSLRRPSLPQHPPRRQDAITRRRINLSHAPSSSRQTQKKPPSSQPRHLCADFHRHRHPHVLDGLLHHRTSLTIKEHYTDTGERAITFSRCATSSGFASCRVCATSRTIVSAW